MVRIRIRGSVRVRIRVGFGARVRLALGRWDIIKHLCRKAVGVNGWLERSTIDDH